MPLGLVVRPHQAINGGIVVLVLDRAINMSEWISVDERLPDNTGKVLGFWLHSGIVDMALFIKNEDGKGRWSSTTGKITHWIPLPAPPSNDN